VSTRCGGPEEFVIPGATGDLVDAQPDAMAQAIASVLTQPVLRERLAAGARQLVRDRYGPLHAEAVFLRELEAAFPELLTDVPAHLPTRAFEHA
jgi:glycosyltransferase involved in cell wall biosynthesis